MTTDPYSSSSTIPSEVEILKKRLLHEASKADPDILVMTELLDRGADFDARDEQMNFRDGSVQEGTALYHVPASPGTCNPALVRFLLQYNAKVTTVDFCGRTALHYACKNGTPECMLLLLETAADVYMRSTGGGPTPLHVLTKSDVD